MDKVLLMYGWDASNLIPKLFAEDAKGKKLANEIWDILSHYDYAYDYKNGKFLIIGTTYETWSGDRYALFDKGTINVNPLETKVTELQRKLAKYWKPSAVPKFFQVCYGDM